MNVVTHATFANWFGGVYQDERNFFPQFAVDTQGYRQMFPEFVIDDEEWAAFLGDKEGAIVGQGLAERFKWKMGDRIPVRGTIYPGTWEFNVRGIYHGQRVQDDVTQFWFRWDYLDERTPGRKGIVGWYTVRIGNPDEATGIAKAIDERFANSPFETRTDTEKAFAAGFVKQMGNIQLLMMSVGSVVFFTLLLVTGNTMAIAVRERTRELAVLKAIGFSDGFVPGIFARHRALVDEVVPVPSEAAIAAMRRLASAHGIFAGPSSGAHFVVAKRFWEHHPELQTVVTVFSDEGEKYVSEYFLEGRG